MNDEIKEILEKLKNYDNYKYRSENGRSYKEIEGWEIDLLLDYITNLQQENEELKKKLDRRYYKNEYERIKQENERLKERINQYENPDDMTLFYMWLDVKAKDKMKEFENQIIMLKQQNQIITQLGVDYKSRCEKAIEYIKQNSQMTDLNIYGIEDVLCFKGNADKLLNILQNGSDSQ